MFTGLVEVIGVVSNLSTLDPTSSGGGGTSLTISGCGEILDDASLGDSISVNGTCLTITELQPPPTAPGTTDATAATAVPSPFFKVGVAPETLRRTNLGSLSQGSKVNLERSVTGSTRMGGHFVQGHVDTVATIRAKSRDGNSVVLRLEPREQSVLRYVVEKGYVGLDGASLTVTKVLDGGDGEAGYFEVMLIAYTQEKVVTAAKEVGEDVNLEIDMVGKYVEKSVKGYFDDMVQRSADIDDGRPAILEKMVERIIKERMGTTTR